MNKYENITLIGSGGFGTVYHVKRKSDGRDFALKRPEKSTLDNQLSALAEMNVLSNLDHPNIVKYVEYFLDGGDLCIVMEFCHEGNLLKKMKGRISPGDAVVMFGQLCRAVDYIHSRRPIVLHRDIKPANILFTSQGVLKLCDFGISKMLERSIDYAKTATGTRYYFAPEVFKGEPYNNKW